MTPKKLLRYTSNCYSYFIAATVRTCLRLFTLSARVDSPESTKAVESTSRSTSTLATSTIVVDLFRFCLAEELEGASAPRVEMAGVINFAGEVEVEGDGDGVSKPYVENVFRSEVNNT